MGEWMNEWMNELNEYVQEGLLPSSQEPSTWQFSGPAEVESTPHIYICVFRIYFNIIPTFFPFKLFH
jgi:hypothetical protein